MTQKQDIAAIVRKKFKALKGLRESDDYNAKQAVFELVHDYPDQKSQIVAEAMDILLDMSKDAPVDADFMLEGLAEYCPDQRQQIVDGAMKILRDMNEEYPEGARLMLEGLAERCPDQKDQLTCAKIDYAHLFSGRKGDVNNIAKDAFDMAAQWHKDKNLCAEHGVKEVVKNEKIVGYTTNKFNVSAASPGFGRHTLVVKHLANDEGLRVYAGGFSGSSSEFEDEIKSTHSDGRTRDRKHYNRVVEHLVRPAIA